MNLIDLRSSFTDFWINSQVSISWISFSRSNVDDPWNESHQPILNLKNSSIKFLLKKKSIKFICIQEIYKNWKKLNKIYFDSTFLVCIFDAKFVYKILACPMGRFCLSFIFIKVAIGYNKNFVRNANLRYSPTQKYYTKKKLSSNSNDPFQLYAMSFRTSKRPPKLDLC